MDKPEFPIEYHTDVPVLPVELQDEIESRLLKLASGNTDMTSAKIAVTEPASREVPFIFEARIVVSARPETIVANQKADTLESALKGALNAIERQVREKRKKLGEPWKRSDDPTSPGSTGGEGG